MTEQDSTFPDFVSATVKKARNDYEYIKCESEALELIRDQYSILRHEVLTSDILVPKAMVLRTLVSLAAICQRVAEDLDLVQE